MPAARTATSIARPQVTGFFDDATNTISYVVADEETGKAAIIDSVLDFDPASGEVRTVSADRLLSFVKEHGLRVEWILETHVHADHLTAAPHLKRNTGAKTAIGARVCEVQSVFADIFNAEPGFAIDGSQFDLLLSDDDVLPLGNLEIRALATPGHTPACMTLVIGDAAFVGDTLFMPDFGTARTDFPGGDAGQLYRSIQSIFELPGDTRLFMCHDYKAPGRDEYQWETTVAEQRSSSVHVHDGVTESEFVRFRNERDATLGMPRLLLPSVQVNMRAGELPPAESNGTNYLKIPVKLSS